MRDEFPGKKIVNALIDLPFALPTIVIGLVLLALYGNGSPLGIDVAFTRASIALALLFVTLPFVVRSVQPVLIELDRSMEEAAASLGAGPATVLRRIVLPALTPAIVSGVALSFARAVGEFGSLVLITGNLPFKTEVGSVYVFGQIQDENLPAAAAVSVVLLARGADRAGRAVAGVALEVEACPLSKLAARTIALGLSRAAARGAGGDDLLQDLRTRPRARCGRRSTNRTRCTRSGCRSRSSRSRCR